MAQAMQKTVYACGECTKEHETKEAAEKCEAAHTEQREFMLLVSRFQQLREQVRKKCKHQNYQVLCSEDTVDFTDSRVTEYTKQCAVCDKVWKDHKY